MGYVLHKLMCHRKIEVGICAYSEAMSNVKVINSETFSERKITRPSSPGYGIAADEECTLNPEKDFELAISTIT